MYKLIFALFVFIPQFAFAASEFESNDSSSQANTLSSNGSVITGNLSSFSDVDWYKVTSSGSGTLKISFSSPYCPSGAICTLSIATWNIDVYNSSNSKLNSKLKSTSDTFKTLTFTTSLPSSGTYYIKVSSGIYSGANYDISATVTTTTPLPSPPPPSTGSMTLKDAIYLYNQNLNSYWYTDLVANNCDIFELVLDVKSGYTDISLYEDGASGYEGGFSPYPDRIFDFADMFVYTLYSNATTKVIRLFGNEATQSNGKSIGSATVFGYCFSTKSNANVYMWDEQSNTCKYSDGHVVTNCQ